MKRAADMTDDEINAILDNPPPRIGPYATAVRYAPSRDEIVLGLDTGVTLTVPRAAISELRLLPKAQAQAAGADGRWRRHRTSQCRRAYQRPRAGRKPDRPGPRTACGAREAQAPPQGFGGIDPCRDAAGRRGKMASRTG